MPRFKSVKHCMPRSDQPRYLQGMK
jgi:hypothetical protein